MPPPNTPEERHDGLEPTSDRGDTITDGATTAIATAVSAVSDDSAAENAPAATRNDGPAPAPASFGPAPAPASSPTYSVTPVDFHALEYDSVIDENLMCPICHNALVGPVITGCEHVFCRDCLVKAHADKPVCPVDRLPLRLADIATAPKMVHNQLDSLVARCPYTARGCCAALARSLMPDHVARYCADAPVPCPLPTCDQSLTRHQRDTAKGCLHYPVECSYCAESLLQADLDRHQDATCPERTAPCDMCGADYLRSRRDAHLAECPEAEAPCRFASVGCSARDKRRLLADHLPLCEYRVVGPVGDQLARLRADIGALQERDALKDRRIKLLESFSLAPTSSAVAPAAAPGVTASMSDLGNSFTAATQEAAASAAPYESRDQYFLSLFETMEAKVERLASAMTEAEGRQSMMLFNETVQIKDQLTEIRSTLGVLGMHVRWLMNFRLQERGSSRIVGAPSPGIVSAATAGAQSAGDGGGGGGGAGQGFGGDTGLARRGADGFREMPPRL